ncbi:membrane protein insertion efficiency factor YidD [Streptomyces sp. NPDC050856]|uniref:membrane protein insertion efficiency factor YidD n=1 Tax=Streptomyces sp. NPDC050856 TaxID=3154939 RepID=UPI0033C9717B
MPGQRYGKRRRGRRGDDGRDEHCVEGALDGCACCGRSCSGLWPAVLVLALARPAGRPGAASAEDPAAPRPAGRVAGAMYEAVRHYRARVSPARPACCPYTPSCSTYAVKALGRHGALRGGRLVLGRLLRCRPGAARRRGFGDPVPD